MPSARARFGLPYDRAGTGGPLDRADSGLGATEVRPNRQRARVQVPLRTTDALGFAVGAKVSKTADEPYFFSKMQGNDSAEDWPIVHEATLSEYRQKPNFPDLETPPPLPCRFGHKSTTAGATSGGWRST